MQQSTLSPDSASITEEELLSSCIKKAMQITGEVKETDLAQYLPHNNDPMSKEVFIHLKKVNRSELSKLLKEKILDNSPEKQLSRPKDATDPESKDHKTSEIHTKNDLQAIIQRGIAKTQSQKEADLCQYIIYQNNRLHHNTYHRMKKENPALVASLIEENILNRTPKKHPRSYKTHSLTKLSIGSREQPSENSPSTLKEIIEKAMKRRKLKIRKESDLCRYIPREDGGFLYYSTFRSLKKNDPEKLSQMVERHILSPRHPKKIEAPYPPLSATPQQSDPVSSASPEENEGEKQLDLISKMNDLIELNSNVLRAINLYKPESNKTAAGIKAPYPEGTHSESVDKKDSDTQEKCLRTIQNQLIKCIRRREVDYELWDTFVELLEKHQ